MKEKQYFAAFRRAIGDAEDAVRDFSARARLLFTLDGGAYKKSLGCKYAIRPAEAYPPTPIELEARANIVKALRAAFGGRDIGEALLELDPMERVGLIEELWYNVADAAGLEGVDFAVSYDLPASVASQYVRSDSCVAINGACLHCGDPLLLKSAVDALLHEARHAMQFEAMRNKNAAGRFAIPQFRAWLDSLANLPNASLDLASYRRHILEVDANAYAIAIINAYEQTSPAPEL